MARVLVTRQIPGRALEELRRTHEVVVYPGPGKMPRDKLLEGVRGVEAILAILTEKIDAEVLEAAGPNLKIVANYAVGFDNVDVEAASRRGVMVTNTPGALGDAVAEFTVALVMALGRRVVAADKFMRQGKYSVWDPNIFLGQDLSGKTLGIVGAGTIGSVVGKRLAAVFGMQVLYSGHRPNVEFEQATGGKLVALEQLLQEADVVSLHVPLTAETRHMISFEEFRLMKSTAILINTSRGPVVEEKALREALEQKRIWGAAVDVYEEEVEGEAGHLNPEDWQRLKSLDNLILTPHIASATYEAREEMTSMAVSAIMKTLRGERPENLVNLEVWKGGD